MKPKTYNQGANDERTAVIASLRRDFLKYRGAVSDYIDWKIKWLLQRNERYNAKAGGLGKK